MYPFKKKYGIQVAIIVVFIIIATSIIAVFVPDEYVAREVKVILTRFCSRKICV